MGNKNNRKKRKLRYDRIGLAAIIAAGTLVGTNFFRHRSSIKNNTKIIEETDDVFTKNFDNYKRIVGIVNTEFPIYALSNVNNEVISMLDSKEGDIITIYKSSKILDSNNVEYYSCELEDLEIVGLIKKSDILKITQKQTFDCKFNDIYMQKDVEKEIKTSFKKNSKNLGENIKKDEIIFVDEFSARQDSEKNIWVKIRTNTGKVGYTILDSSLEKVDQVNVMEINADLQKIVKANDNQSVNDEIKKDLSKGDRVASICSKDPKKYVCVVYFDKNGIAKYGELNSDYLNEVEFKEPIKTNIEKMKNTSNDIELINSYIKKWNLDYTAGSVGIDFCDSMDPEDLKTLLEINPKIDFCITKIGGTYYGDQSEKIMLAKNSTVFDSKDYKKKVMSQIEVAKKMDKKVMGYFYSTDINSEEGYQIAGYVEQCVDELGGGIFPIIDVELAQETEDRMYWLNKPNYNEYISTHINAMEIQKFNFEELENMDAGARMTYVKNNPAIIDYINFCQTKKAEGIAAIYSKLYKDGYIGKNAILYTGNRTVSSNDYITTIKTAKDASFESIVVFKYDEVINLLTNSESPYFISEDFNLKVWYADYTNQENFKMLDNGTVITQCAGNLDVPGASSRYDMNYACKEFIKIMFDEKIIEDTYIPKKLKDDDEYIME